MSDLTGKTVAFLVAPEGIEQVELTEPWAAVEKAGATPQLLSTTSGKVQAFEHLDKADTFPVDEEVGDADPAAFAALVLPGGVANPDALRLDEDAVAFVKAYKERFKKAPTYTAATYDAIMLLKDAIEKQGTTNADKIVAYIEKVEHVGTGAVVTFDKRHDLNWAVGKTSGIAVQWQDGKKVPFWPPNIKGMQPFKMPAQ